MKRFFLPLLICIALPILSFSQTTSSRKSSKGGSTATRHPFTQTCDSPSFPSPTKTPPDSTCGITGKGGAEANQNKAKNDFCASGDPNSIDFAKLKDLQAQVAANSSIDWGNKKTEDHGKGPTVDRAPLEQLGEGQLVQLKGFVLIARQEGAESVNCGANIPNKPVDHDIHISIVPTADETDECNSVVVEMSPHHRPTEWTAANVEKIAQAHTAVRVTGHLFFDSSHVPCADGQPVPSNPKRFSLWEIHPIYQFEVCTADCDGAGQWSPLVDFINNGSQ